MSRVSGPTRSGERGQDGRVAALHRQGDVWRLIVVEADGARKRVAHAESIRFGDVAAARALIARHKPERVIRVAPASRTVCRLVEIPTGSPAEMGDAANLLAEAGLPALAPPHRRGAGVIGGAPGPGRRHGLILAWIGANDEPIIDAARERWTSEIVAIAGLIPKGGMGQALYADRAGGSIAVFAVNGSASVARTVREPDAAPEAWPAIVGHAIEETQAALGSSMRLVRDYAASSTMCLDEPAHRRALEQFTTGAPRGDRWLDEYGVALGAALGALDADASDRGLYELQSEPRRARRSIVSRGVEWLGVPRNAIALGVACLALGLTFPIGADMLRVVILKSRLSAIEQRLEGRESARALDRRSAFLDELVARRWPMTKLLSDLGGALPVGLEVESITMDRGARVQVRGEAKSLELANKAVATLNSSGVFTNAQLMQTRSTPGGSLEYRIEAEVANPFATARGIEDFSSDTLAVRLYGERARVDSRQGGALASGDAEAAPEPEETGGSTRSRSRERSSGPTFTGEAPDRAETVEVPPPLTDEEIQAMTNLEAMREVANRIRAAAAAESEEDRTRLRDEVARLREHARNSGDKS